MPRGQKTCSQCQTAVAPRVKVCPSCGNTFTPKEKPSVKAETPAQQASGELGGILDDLFGDITPQTGTAVAVAVPTPTAAAAVAGAFPDDIFGSAMKEAYSPSPEVQTVANGEVREVQVVNGRLILTPSGPCPVPWTSNTRLHQWIEEVEKSCPEGYQYAGSALRYWLKTVLPREDYPGLVRLIS